MEWLEDRLALNGDLIGDTLSMAQMVPISIGDVMTITERIDTPADVDFFAFDVPADHFLHYELDTQIDDDQFFATIRSFSPDGAGVLQDSYSSLAPLFETSGGFTSFSADRHYLAISSHGNDFYDPNDADDRRGSFAGSYSLKVWIEDFVGDATSMAVLDSTAMWGGVVTLRYTVANPLDLSPGQANIEIRLSPDNVIDESDTLLAAFLAGQEGETQQPRGTVVVTLPGLPGSAPADFPTAGAVYLGMRAFPTYPFIVGGTPESVTVAAPLSIIAPVSEAEPNGTAQTAIPFVPQGKASGNIAAANDADYYTFTLRNQGLLTLECRATANSSLDVRLALYGPQGELLGFSDDNSAGGLNALISQHLEPGNYLVAVTGYSNSPTGAYELITAFLPSSAPGLPMTASVGQSVMLAADVNGDGKSDAILADFFQSLTVLFGVGNGGFSEPMRIPLSITPQILVSGHFNSDPYLDLAVIGRFDAAAGKLVILTGRSDGTFDHGSDLLVPNFPLAAAAADLNGDQVQDLAVSFISGFTDPFPQLAIFFGDGNAGFVLDRMYRFLEEPNSIVAEDFDNDGATDLAAAFSRYVSNPVSQGSILVLWNRGDGVFDEQDRRGVPTRNYSSLVTGDFNGDGLPDLLANEGSFESSAEPRGVISLLGTGQRDFTEGLQDAANRSASDVVSNDFNEDGRTDVVYLSNGPATLALGQANGSFVVGRIKGFVSDVARVMTGDFNGDSHADLIYLAASGLPAISLLLGKGDGTFEGQSSLTLGRKPGTLLSVDVNRDGLVDLTAVNQFDNSVSVLLGHGDGTFRDATQLTTPGEPQGLAAGDFNGDGRLDLATTNLTSPLNSRDTNIAVFLGLGNGLFSQTSVFTMPPVVSRGVHGDFFIDNIVSGNFNGDRWDDLVIIHDDIDTVDTANGLAFLSNGDGSFQPGRPLHPAGFWPGGLAVADFNGDRLSDVATGQSYSPIDFETYLDFLGVFINEGNGSFSRIQTEVAADLVSFGDANVVARDFNGDGIPDFSAPTATLDPVVPAVHNLIGRGDGSFQFLGTEPIAFRPVAAGDFNGDGRDDLVTEYTVALFNPNDVRAPINLAVDWGQNFLPSDISVADVNNDGRLDLVATNVMTDDVRVLLGKGNGRFVPADLSSAARLGPPLIRDVNSDGAADVVSLNQRGQILVRLGRDGLPGVLASPLILNPQSPARAFTIVALGPALSIAAVDQAGDQISVYALGPGGAALGREVLAAGVLPDKIAAGDVNRDGRDDLVVTDIGSNEWSLFLTQADGRFGARIPLAAAAGFADLEVKDVDGVSGPDLAFTNQDTGEFLIRFNLGAGTFTDPLPFRAGTGGYGVRDDLSGKLVAHSHAGSQAFVFGDVDRDGVDDVIVCNPGVNQVSVLLGKAGGSFVDPSSFDVGRPPVAANLADFNGDGNADLALLLPQNPAIAIWLGDGRGGFGKGAMLAAGDSPTGLAVHDMNADGRRDLLVGNEFGDVLILLGNGDGTFQEYRRAGQNVALAVADINGDGQDDFIFANESRDRVSVEYSLTGQTYEQDRDDGLLAPGAIQTADLNQDGLLDLIVANGGGNNVLVYLGIGAGQFGLRQEFFAGTNPTGITLAQLNDDNGDSAIDQRDSADLVVANQGSNDVTILLGQGQDAAWTFTSGPRLAVGEGPVASTVQDLTGDGVPDLLVTNTRSDDVWQLDGLGNGFFDDTAPAVFNVGLTPRQTIIGNFDGQVGLDLVTLNAGSNNLTLIRNFTSDLRSVASFASGGVRPFAAFEGDFNDDGLLDLVVANNGDGRIALLAGGGDGLALLDTIASADLPHPTALALAEAGNGFLNIYVSTEGREAVNRISLTFNIPVAELVPLEPQELALVATLLTTGADAGIPDLPSESSNSLAGAQLSEAVLASFQPDFPFAADGASSSSFFSLSYSSFGFEEETPEAGKEAEIHALVQPADPEVVPLIWGEAAAWDRIRQAALERLLQSLDAPPTPEPAKPPSDLPPEAIPQSTPPGDVDQSMTWQRQSDEPVESSRIATFANDGQAIAAELGSHHDSGQFGMTLLAAGFIAPALLGDDRRVVHQRHRERRRSIRLQFGQIRGT